MVKMLNVYCNPTPKAAALDLTNSINQIVYRLSALLPPLGVNFVNEHTDAGLFACHAGIGDGHRADIAHISGLYPTYHFPDHDWHWAANEHVIENVRRAKVVTVPSQWVSDIFARDMHLETELIPWGIDTNEWQPPADNPATPYVLWNKTRVDGICDPAPMNALAKRVQTMQFVSTFGTEDHNVRITGRMPYPAMGTLVQHASVYLATTLETFGIGTLEASACGIPVLGYKWGGTSDLVIHGVTGYLVQPGDIEGLVQGLEYCLTHRKVLGANGRELAKMYPWEQTAAMLADLYKRTYEDNHRPRIPKVSVVIPSYNYAQYVPGAVNSAINQETKFPFEVIVVDDGSTDNTADVLQPFQDKPNFIYYKSENRGVAEARNTGIRRATGEYIICLDADDELGVPNALQTLADALDQRPELGIAYGGLRMINAEGQVAPTVSAWPGEHNFEAQLQHHNQVPTCCMFRRAAWARVGGYRARFTPAEDANFWTWIGAIGYRAAKVTADPILNYRLHSNSLSSAIREGSAIEPDWLFDFKWATDSKVGRPFACDGFPMRGSWAVRNYCLPAVTVIIPCAPHHLPLLRQAIDSVESQTFPFWELIVVLDGEIDYERVRELQQSAPFVRWVATNENGESSGAGHARNIGVKRASAALVTFLDADDRLHPEFLAETIKQHQRTGRYVYTDWRSINKQGVHEDNQCPDYDPALVFSRTSIHSVSILIDKEIFLSVGGFDEEMTAWEDVDLPMKLAVNGHFGTRVPRPLLQYNYNTGKRREVGETIKQELIDLLHDRYKEYIEGSKMCVCQPAPGVHMPPSFGLSALSSNDPATDADIVRIKYIGPHGDHKVRGAVTNTDYRNHQNGDYFMVYRVDVEAQPHLFEIESAMPNLATPTPIPPAPELMGVRIF